MNEPFLHHHIEAIRGEYRRIDTKWLRLHYETMLWLVMLTAAVELLMFFTLNMMDAIVTTPARYIVKYLLVPIAGNVALAALSGWVVRSKRLRISQQEYALSLLLALAALQIYTIHSFYPVLYLIFTIPMLLTVVYADQRLTAVTAAVCIGGKTVSDLFLFWDPTRPPVGESWDSLVNFALSLGMLLLFYLVCRIIIAVAAEKNEASIELERERERMKTLSVTDVLTGLWNRQALQQAFTQISEAGQACSLVMMDLDDFKALNDTYGHSQGDLYLRTLGEVLRKDCRRDGSSAAFRYGGDEFCILFCRQTEAEIRSACTRIQQDFAREFSDQGKMTVSIS
ncbi:MAG: diguanylate cyclase, partial [Oscillibacter sp.]